MMKGHVDRLRATQDRMLDEGLEFADLEPEVKLQYHRDLDAFEARQLRRDVEHATQRLSDPTLDPAEAAYWENELARAAAQQDRLDSRASAVLDDNGDLLFDDHTAGGMEAGWFDRQPSVELPKGDNTFYRRFQAMGEEGREAARQSIADELSKGANEAQSWETFERLGYRYNTETGVVTRPVGLTDDLPAVQVVDGRFIASRTARPDVKYRAELGDALPHGKVLRGDQVLDSELQHSAKQVGRLRERLGVDENTSLTLEQVVDARRLAQEAKGANRLSPQEKAKLESLSGKPPELRTQTEAAAFADLSARQTAYSKAAGDMAAASEVLGEEAAAQVMRSKNPGNMKLLQSGHGRDTYDQIWMDTSSGKVYFVEGKGGSAVNSSARKMPDGFHAQQGSAEYHQNLWEARSKDVEAELGQLKKALKTAPEARRAGIQKQIKSIEEWYNPILRAIKKQNHEYLMVSQKLDGNGLGRAVEREFLTGPDVLQ